jgi:DNA-binding beta-propeller fold protein YncE
MRAPLLGLALALLCAAPLAAQSNFVNWETPQVHPLDLTPDGARLIAVNTADGRIEVFDVSGPSVAHAFDVPVGVDPVSVRCRTSDEVWVVNHVSDSISVVSLAARNVVATLRTQDEPADVVFAGSPLRAYVSCSQANSLQVFDPLSLAAAPLTIPIVGEDPRALAVSPDGSRVYVAIYESGNSTTVLGGGALSNIGVPPNVVNDANGPWGGQNPPPNSGAGFSPPINPALPPPPRVGLIVRKDGAGQWLDDNGGNWTAKVSGASAANSGRPVGWDLADHDIAVVDTATNAVSYVRHLMNICMALSVKPNGEVTLVGTDATNEVRFEPVLRGRFLRVQLARVSAGGATLAIGDLNPHLSYATGTVPQALRDQSLGDPRAIVWNAAGTKGFVAGLGSNNVAVIDAQGARAGLQPAIEVPEGPTGLVLDEARGRLYVLSKFAARLAVVELASEQVVQTLAFHDASPAAIRAGRKHLYDTRKTSGLGHVACASCHVDGRVDGLGWDLGDPAGAMRPVAGNNLGAGLPGLNTGFQDFHPMKGPMTTQTLQDIIGHEPLHWRGDRFGLEEFNGAFTALQGDDVQLTPAEMQEFENFLATIHYPPNPYRNDDNSLPTNLPLPGHYTPGRFGPSGQPLPNGNAALGLTVYRPPQTTPGGMLLDGGNLACVTCHTLPTGAGTNHRLVGGTLQPFPIGPNGERHLALVSVDGLTNVSMKTPQLRNLYEKTGFDLTRTLNTRGFGMLHDGSVGSIAQFVAEPVFNVTSDQMVANLVAFMLALSGSDLPQGSTNPALLEPPGVPSKDTHALVGRQLTLAGPPSAEQNALLTLMTQQANLNRIGIVAKGVVAGETRGYAFIAGVWRSDRLGQNTTLAALVAGAAPGAEITFTAVPTGSAIRLGYDRDFDGWYDRDELDLGSDPADPQSFPGGTGLAFCLGDGSGAACPCGNASAPAAQAGCLNSFGQGGRLGATGSASLLIDTLVLAGSQMPDSSALYFQGTLRSAGGAGIAFGDGLRCAGGTNVRLATKTNSGGASQFPGPADPSVSAAGLVAAPGTRTYQVWYRNAAPFCTADTFNLTNGWVAVWGP